METTFTDGPRVRSGAQKMQAGAMEIKDAALDRAGQYRDAAVNKAMELKDAAVQTGTDAMQRGSDAVKQYRDQTETLVKENPLESLLVACAVGLILGALLTRCAR